MPELRKNSGSKNWSTYTSFDGGHWKYIFWDTKVRKFQGRLIIGFVFYYETPINIFWFFPNLNYRTIVSWKSLFFEPLGKLIVFSTWWAQSEPKASKLIWHTLSSSTIKRLYDLAEIYLKLIEHLWTIYLVVNFSGRCWIFYNRLV